MNYALLGLSPNDTKPHVTNLGLAVAVKPEWDKFKNFVEWVHKNELSWRAWMVDLYDS